MVHIDQHFLSLSISNSITVFPGLVLNVLWKFQIIYIKALLRFILVKKTLTVKCDFGMEKASTHHTYPIFHLQISSYVSRTSTGAIANGKEGWKTRDHVEIFSSWLDRGLGDLMIYRCSPPPANHWWAHEEVSELLLHLYWKIATAENCL